MPCRPTPEEEYWAARFDVEQVQQRTASQRDQRATTLTLLRAILERAGVPVEDGKRVLALTRLETSSAPASDNDLEAARQEFNAAEAGLCLARFTLLQIVSLLPMKIVAPFAERIAAERSDHLRHRLDDCAAEIATLESRIRALAGQVTGAEVEAVKAEIARLRGLGPAQLLADRDFSAPVACPRCGVDLPVFPGVTTEHLHHLAWSLDLEGTVHAIKQIHALTGLSLREARIYVTCPHRVPEPEPEPAARSPYRCRTCRKPLPPINGLTRAQADGLLMAEVRGEADRRLALLLESTGWSRKDALRYLACPHRLPKAGG